MTPKTDLPCDCGAIAVEMSESKSTYSLRDNAFWINGYIVMNFCPFCGGKLPDSSKPIFVPCLTAAEQARLRSLAEGIRSPEEAIARLGPPDYDELITPYHKAREPFYMEVDTGIEEIPESVVLAGLAKPTRKIEFTNLSPTGNVEFYFKEGRPTYRIISPKPLPPRHLEEGEVV